MQKYDLYWYRYKYSRNPNEGNVVRPVIILDGDKALPICMEVTKHPPRIDEPYQWDYPIEHWREAGLLVPSTAKVGEINYVDRNLPESDYMGHLSDFNIENLKIIRKKSKSEVKLWQKKCVNHRK